VTEPEEIILENTEYKRVNVKSMTMGSHLGVPYYKFEAVNGKKGYSYDMNKGMYPTMTAMLDALAEEQDAD
jgi:hypothetical protein